MERALVKVDVGACRCPDRRHTSGDWVELYPTSTIPIGTAVYAAIRAAGDDNVLLQGLMARAYVLLGIKRWSFVDRHGEPIPVTPGHAGWADLVDELLPWTSGGAEIASKADSLYSEEILRPLTSRPSQQSQGGQTVGSTSATPRTSPTNRKRSTQSSRKSTVGKPSVDPGS